MNRAACLLAACFLVACASAPKTEAPAVDPKTLETIEDISRIVNAKDRLRALINLAKSEKAMKIAGEENREKLIGEIAQYKDQLDPMSEIEKRFVADMISKCEIELPQLSRSTSKGFYEKTTDGFSGKRCPVEHSMKTEVSVDENDQSQESITETHFKYKLKAAVSFTDIESIVYNQRIDVISAENVYRTEVSGPVTVKFKDRSGLTVEGFFRIMGVGGDRAAVIDYKYVFTDPQNKAIGRHTLTARGKGDETPDKAPETWSMYGTFDGRALNEQLFYKLLFPQLNSQ